MKIDFYFVIVIWVCLLSSCSSESLMPREDIFGDNVVDETLTREELSQVLKTVYLYKESLTESMIKSELQKYVNSEEFINSSFSINGFTRSNYAKDIEESWWQKWGKCAAGIVGGACTGAAIAC